MRGRAQGSFPTSSGEHRRTRGSAVFQRPLHQAEERDGTKNWRVRVVRG